MKEPATRGEERQGNRELHPVPASVASILRAQSPGGAVVASPDFAQYQYCWLRDGSFIAFALDLAGEHEASGRFHRWCARALDGIEQTMLDAIARHAAGLAPTGAPMPPARFSLGGQAVDDDWPNFQLDGYGTWLWALDRHLSLSGGGALPAELAPAVERTSAYLAALGTSACFDVWEESGGSVHTSTLACVYGGLHAAAAMLGEGSFAQAAAEVQGTVMDNAARTGYFNKSDHSEEVDGSLLWLCEPFHLVPASHPAMAATAARIASELELDGGTRRYPSDVYYGSGAWPVLTSSLGLYYCAAGDLTGAQARLEWVSSQVDWQGRLAEQYGGERRDPAHYQQWVRQWGPPAAELIWSHAMYIALSTRLGGTAGPQPPPALPEPEMAPVSAIQPISTTEGKET